MKVVKWDDLQQPPPAALLPPAPPVPEEMGCFCGDLSFENCRWPPTPSFLSLFAAPPGACVLSPQPTQPAASAAGRQSRFSQRGSPPLSPQIILSAEQALGSFFPLSTWPSTPSREPQHPPAFHIASHSTFCISQAIPAELTHLPLLVTSHLG